MKLSFRAGCALLALAAATVPARAPAQDAEAWVLPRGLLELSATGLYTYYDSRLGYGDPPLGSEFLGPLSGAADRLLAGLVTPVQTGLNGFFARVPDNDPATQPAAVSAGALSLRLAADVRQVPLSLRYGLTDRMTLFLTVPFERRGTSAIGPFLGGGTLGVNPNTTANAAVLEGIDPALADLGRSALLPTRGSAAGMELQARLRALDPADTLALPAFPVRISQLLENTVLRQRVTEEEAAALGLTNNRRPYQLGDAQLGVRFLLRPGPAGWPFPDSVTRRSFRTSVGARVRLPTGRSGTRFFSEIAPGGGHFGLGVDVLNDVFISRRWFVNASASLDYAFPAEVPRLAFTATRPFPADSAQRRLRREPGPRLAFSLTPRWRLTDEISFSGEYALLAQGRTNYTGGEDEGLLLSPMEWRTGGTMHAVGVGARFSSLQAFARGRADLPFELTLSFQRAIAGAGLAPDAGSLRLTARIFTDPRRFAALLPGDPPPADTLAVPAGPLDTLPSQVRPDTTTPRVQPPAPGTAVPVVQPPASDSVPADSAARPVPPSAPSTASPASAAVSAASPQTLFSAQPQSGTAAVDADRRRSVLAPPGPRTANGSPR